jgi:hypothetical protein
MMRLLESRPVFGTVCLALGLSLGLTQGCARSAPSHSSDAASAVSEQKLPFHPHADQASAAEGVHHPRVSPDPQPASAVPFNSHPHTLPSGTLLTVQLQDSLSAAKVRDGDTFTASVAAPLTVDGDPLIDRGTVATGHVESVRSQAGSGYFQLTLSALTVEGRPLPLQTTSLFARGTLQQSDGVRVQKGRRLTFRLTSPVTLNEPRSMANRQSLGATTQ